ncbi:alpha/beta-hydrolase [Glonium stellatum]|uniref:Carboxylic ester hydrolase n=1 Tax=Glonium stellatum TaxID=574774 RepID=A0A8E2EUV0_9PEZI|nr:alpha/beta-hydrolase [Glonium stellatum]
MAELKHSTLNATLRGVDLGRVRQFRGIQYGRIPGRFKQPEMMNGWEGKVVDCTKYGPRCPQNHYDVGHLLRIPEEHVFEKEEESEFGCLNLDVTVPLDLRGRKGSLPVLVWIHGGSQIMTFGSGASRICDTTKIIDDSILQGKPIIVVSITYRLNIFAFGDCKGEVNLALKDQRLAIEWVQKHIEGFGGDTGNVTLAGESAGAVYVHAHVVAGAPLNRAILSSGSLYLSPPLPLSRGQATVEALEHKLKEAGHGSLQDAPVYAILKSQADLALNSLWLQDEPILSDWQMKTGDARDLLVGDVEYESIIWRNGVEAMTSRMIAESFAKAGEYSSQLSNIYCISPNRPTPSKIGALDFMADVRFGLAVRKIVALWKSVGKPAYRYIVDQANPWQASSRAHHAVDLVLLFGGLDLSFNPGAEKVGREMRMRWISFVNGEAPWSKEQCFAFGPFGECKEIDVDQFAARRRVKHLDLLEKMDGANINACFGALAAGRISLLN